MESNDEQEKQSSKVKYVMWALGFLVLLIIYSSFKTAKDSQYDSGERDYSEKIVAIKKAENFFDLGYTLDAKDLDKKEIVSELKRMKSYEQKLLEYIIFQCAQVDSNGNASNQCSNKDYLIALIKTFNISLPKDDGILSKNYVENVLDKVSIKSFVEYNGILKNYQSLVGANLAFSSAEQGLILSKKLQDSLYKSGMNISEYKETVTFIESSSCSGIPKEHFLFNICNTDKKKWGEYLTQYLTSKVYSIAKEDRANDRLKELRSLREEVEELRESRQGTGISSSLNVVIGKIDSKMPSDYEIERDNARSYIEAQSAAIQLQGLIQKQKELNQKQGN